MIKKIIYVGYMPLTDKVIEDFYINDALLHNYVVEYWDISHLIFVDVFDKKLKNKSYEFIFKRLNQVESRIKSLDLDKSLFILNFTYRFNVLKIFFCSFFYRLFYRFVRIKNIYINHSHQSERIFFTSNMF